MADILIRMEMPKEPTPLILYPDGRWNDYTDGANGEFLSLPEGHGRLVDLDALINELQKLFNKREKDARFGGNREASVTWNDAIYHIFAAPIIIPAEGGTDE